MRYVNAEITYFKSTERWFFYNMYMIHYIFNYEDMYKVSNARYYSEYF